MLTAKSAALVAACTSALALAGCSGSSAVGPSFPAGSGSSSSSTGPISIGWQTAGTTVFYTVSSDAGTISTSGTAAISSLNAGNSGTVAITTDSSGNLSKLTFAVPTGSSNFTGSFTGSALTQAPTISLSTLSAMLTAVGASSGSSGVVVSGGGLSYGIYGMWAINDTGTSGRAGTFGVGSLTPSGSVPTTGTGVYTGSTLGYGVSSGVGYAIAGSMQVTANFATSIIATTTTISTLQNLSTQAVSTSGFTFSGSARIFGNVYSGSLTSPYNGVIVGAFNGPTAQETTGVWTASLSGANYVGSFGAKR